MASKNKAQRIGIWIIAIVMTIGTIGSFAAIILANDNAKVDQAQQQKDYNAQLEAYKQQQQANADNSEGFGSYSARKFDATKVTKLIVEVLKQGTGAAIKSTDSVNASYFGWTADGKLFDSSKKKNTSDVPATFALSSVITGWSEGLAGVKVGSVVRLTIPSDKAYGATEAGIIPANSPLEFIVDIHKIDNSSASA